MTRTTSKIQLPPPGPKLSQSKERCVKTTTPGMTRSLVTKSTLTRLRYTIIAYSSALHVIACS
ncbi:hypothetical protein GYH30_027727 [Glycine max]|nr:hypothetical protein GYH30_027727 [Glycine max]